MDVGLVICYIGWESYFFVRLIVMEIIIYLLYRMNKMLSVVQNYYIFISYLYIMFLIEMNVFFKQDNMLNMYCEWKI